MDPPTNFFTRAKAWKDHDRRSRHPDPVAAGYGPTSQLPCITLFQHDLHRTCAESVLRLAAQVSSDKNSPKSELSLNLPDGATIQQMRRRLMHIGLATFPIYIFLTPAPGPIPDDYEPQYIQFRGSKPRDDNWVCLYIPADPERRYAIHRGAPLGPLQAHWTFVQLTPPKEAPLYEPRPHPQGIIFYSRMPIARDEPDVLWRCSPHKDNYRDYCLRKLAHDSLACTCDLGTVCRHEEAFLRDHPNAMRVSLLEDHMRKDAYRATVLQSPGMRVGPSGTVVVKGVNSTSVLRNAYDCDALLDIGKMITPINMLSYGLFHRVPEPWIEQTASPFECPVEIVEIDIGNVRMMCSRFEPRYGIWGAVQACLLTVGGIFGTYCSIRQFPLKALTAGRRVPNMTPALIEARKTPVKTITQTLYMRMVNMIPDIFKRIHKQLSSLQLPGAQETLEHVSERVTDAIVGEKWYSYVYRRAFTTTNWLLGKVYANRDSICALAGFSLSAFALYQVYRYAICRWRRPALIPTVCTHVTRPFADSSDLQMTIPSEEEVLSRLSLLPQITKEHAFDILRRISAEKSWRVKYNPHEAAAWVERVVTEPGMMRLDYDKPGKCVNCKERPRTYRLICKHCQKKMRELPLEDFIPSDALVTYVGMLPIFSQTFNFPKISIRPGVTVKFNKKLLFDENSDDSNVRSWYAHQDVRVSCRGRSCGPTFLGQRPKCFPRGHPTAIIGFLLRLGSTPPCQADWEWYERLLSYIDYAERYPKIQPEDRDVFISHFKGEKLAKMLEAESDINAGKVRWPDPENPVCVMGGFTKMEKSNKEKFVDACLKGKDEEKPRFICCPKAPFLFTIGPYTHAQTKWLSTQYTWQDRLFYAGCATPQDMNNWLNFTLEQMGSFMTIADDISSCDASHSECSMRFHKRLRAKLFGLVPWHIELLYEAEEHLRIRIGNFEVSVDNVNGSGVSDTSFKNSAVCILVRLFATAHAIRDLTTFVSEDELWAFITSVRDSIYTSASGDDGLTRIINLMFGTNLKSPESRDRYQRMWGYFGFKVTVDIYDEEDWRLATYLACRPTWTGKRYEFTPEPARRLRNLFWQLDNTMHPVVWARSIAQSVKVCAGANPILGPIADWYLRNTQGPIVEQVGIFDNPNSVWHGYVAEGKRVTERAINEMFLDYRVDAHDYQVFINMLESTPSVYVNFSCHLLEQVFRRES